MAYKNPRDVDSPRDRWKLIDVLYESGDGGDSLAIGEWDKGRVLAARWNGSEAHDGVGNPQSRGLATWFILPEWMNEGILKSKEIPTAKVNLAKALLDVD
ncbi:hypothetical protein [Caulobacter sp. NIBR1757]|uniref:hypothetical protein n=1 Tax=Caulobacter sp. NIBR1757 TaxID=3016000 RepID=UPI0022F101C2|nr:hypothetical protein [Caulobacter sp. NIBR1757]WGM37529.1 hypothetical protein AMEJIAPC_00428 [Caulobacter sp. NIBR1757]